MSSSTAKKSTRKKTAVEWRCEEPLDTQGKRIHHMAQCSKWLKTQMDRDSLTYAARVSPYRHPLPSSHCNDQVDVAAVLHQKSYEHLPVDPRIGLGCAFCHGPVQCHLPVACWKNSYSVMPWTVMCQPCSEKTSFQREI